MHKILSELKFQYNHGYANELDPNSIKEIMAFDTS